MFCACSKQARVIFDTDSVLTGLGRADLKLVFTTRISRVLQSVGILCIFTRLFATKIIAIVQRKQCGRGLFDAQKMQFQTQAAATMTDAIDAQT